MLERLGTGLFVTDLMGQGVNYVTGDYSRGVGGFWVGGRVVGHGHDGPPQRGDATVAGMGGLRAGAGPAESSSPAAS